VPPPTVCEIAGVTGPVTDASGNTYSAVSVETQCWLKENLKNTSGVADGNHLSNEQWASNTSPSYCYYNNDPGNVSTYGVMYNWYAAGNVCPSGWRLPNKTDWDILRTSLFSVPSLSSFFTNPKGGHRALDVNGGGIFAYFEKLGERFHYWTSTSTTTPTPSGGTSAYVMMGTNVLTENQNAKQTGSYVRCIKN